MRGRLPPMWALLVLFLLFAGASTVAALPVESEWEFMTDLHMMPSCQSAALSVKTLSTSTDLPGSSEIEVLSALYCVIAGD